MRPVLASSADVSEVLEWDRSQASAHQGQGSEGWARQGAGGKER